MNSSASVDLSGMVLRVGVGAGRFLVAWPSMAAGLGTSLISLISTAGRPSRMTVLANPFAVGISIPSMTGLLEVVADGDKDGTGALL
jgi:hypothetical protein